VLQVKSYTGVSRKLIYVVAFGAGRTTVDRLVSRRPSGYSVTTGMTVAVNMLLVVDTLAGKLRRLELQIAETTQPVQADALAVDSPVHPVQLDETVGVCCDDDEFDHGAILGVSGS